MWAKFVAWLGGLFKHKYPPKKAYPPNTIHAPSLRDLEDPPWLKAAYGEVGIKEAAGPLDNPRVIAYHMSTTLDKAAAQKDETPWCSSFTNWCMEQAGYRGTDSAWARSWLQWGRPLEVPQRGCVVVFSRGTSSGHVAFFIKEVGPNILCLGGNQSDSVCEALYPKHRLLGYRWPKNMITK
jgi:uncharacterized protein (TIGR02594 family)